MGVGSRRSAQNVCADIQRRYASASFDVLTDEQNFEDNYGPGLYLPNAYSCWIDTSDVSLFARWWRFDAPDQASAMLDQLQASMKPCLVGWKQTDLTGTQSGAKPEIARGFSLGGSACDPNAS